MKNTTIHFFPVGNGDMTLIKLATGNKHYTVLVDMYIRKCGKDDDDKLDALQALHAELVNDSEGRPYIDVVLLTHPDEDHILGFEEFFHVGSPSEYKKPAKGEKGKIFVREIWSSPIVFRRKSKDHSLCSDALAFQKEAKRRVNLYKSTKKVGQEGDRVRLIGKDSDGKTDDIMSIVYELGNTISRINEMAIPGLQVTVLGPLADDDFSDGQVPDKNRSSVVLHWAIAASGSDTANNYVLLGGDADVAVWEILWSKHKKQAANLQYDILLAPHHCSWHTLSHDSRSECDAPKVSDDAKSALSQALDGAVIVSSSDPIKDDDKDPPCYAAKEEYQSIVNGVSGEFVCLGEHKPSKGKAPEVLVYKLTSSGPQADSSSRLQEQSKATAASGVGLTRKPIQHG